MHSSPIRFLLDRFEEDSDREAFIYNGNVSTYSDLLSGIEMWAHQIAKVGIRNGSVVILKGDYSAETIACFLALIGQNAIVIPVSTSSFSMLNEFAAIGQAEFIIDMTRHGESTETNFAASHFHYKRLRDINSPGIVLFSSGTTGSSKGAVHDASKLLSKFHIKRKDLRTLAFLLFDHIGGLDTLFYCLSNSSTLVFADTRDPEHICSLISKYKVEVLPTAPSFLNLLLISDVYLKHDLSSLKIITYGAEMMPQNTLEWCADVFPNVKLIQKYGTSEIGTMRSRSRNNRSRWVSLGGEGYKWRIRNGQLEVKANSAMLGYINAPDPFTSDGFFQTGDCVEVDGDYIRFTGRDSQVINVGGKKVFPAEIESLVNELEEVAEVSVYGQPSALVGNIVCCKIRKLQPKSNSAMLRTVIKKHVASHLESYKVPQKILFSDESLSTDRFKQIRS